MDILTHVGVFMIYAVRMIPLLLSFYFLGRVFQSISKGQIFIKQNANDLLSFGLLRLAGAVLVPFVILMLGALFNLFTSSKISIATGQTMLGDLFSAIAFIVAAYIIHYGIHLQDEADHTL